MSLSPVALLKAAVHRCSPKSTPNCVMHGAIEHYPLQYQDDLFTTKIVHVAITHYWEQGFNFGGVAKSLFLSCRLRCAVHMAHACGVSGRAENSHREQEGGAAASPPPGQPLTRCATRSQFDACQGLVPKGIPHVQFPYCRTKNLSLLPYMNESLLTLAAKSVSRLEVREP